MTHTTAKTHTARALITGASRGLGRALAQALAERGWHLLLTGRNLQALAQVQAELSPLSEVSILAGDVADPAHQQELANYYTYGRPLELLVNNASDLGPSPLPALRDYPLGALESVYRRNVFAPLALIQQLAPFFSAQPKLINISSDAAREAYAQWGGYGSSKAALEQLSAVLAAEEPDWRVYWVDPGDMRTDMHQAAFPGEDISDRPLPESSVPGLLQLIEGNWPSGRYAARSELLNPRLQAQEVSS